RRSLLVGAADGVSEIREQFGDPAHADSTDADEVDVPSFSKHRDATQKNLHHGGHGGHRGSNLLAFRVLPPCPQRPLWWRAWPPVAMPDPRSPSPHPAAPSTAQLPPCARGGRDRAPAP